MSKNRKYVVMLTVAMLLLGTLTAAWLWGTGSSPVLAAPGDLVAHKSVSSQEIPPGQTVEYTIVLTNTTSSALTGVSVSDALDPLLSVLTVGSLGWAVDTTTPGYITFTTSTLAANAVVTASFVAVLDSAAVGDTVIDNVATFSAVGVDAATTNNASFTVSSTPDLQIYAPESGAVVTTRPGQIAVVSGRAWTEFDPPPFPEPPVLNPIANSDENGSYYVVWSLVSDAQNYVLQQSSELGFDNPQEMILDATDTPKLIGVASTGTYYYRIASVSLDPVTFDERRSRWSNVESVVVTSVSVSSLQSADLAWGEATVQPLATNAAIEVQVSVDNGSSWNSAVLTETLDGWWDWTYNWTVTEGDKIQQVIQARANYVGVDKYATDAITVTLDNSKIFIYMPVIFKYWPPIPYAPTLNDVSIIGDGNDFRVSWTYSDGSASIPDPIDYQLQQASDAAFTTSLVQYTVTGMSTDLLDRSGGSYYYRVRGRNAYGYGPWSATKNVLIGRDYQFTSSTEGWFIARSDEGEGQQLPAPVWNDGKLYHLVWGKADFSILSPMQPGPVAPYTLEAKVDIVDSETIGDHTYKMLNGMTYGIIFGGNNASPCPATRYDPNGCLNQYYRILVSYDMGTGSLKWQLKRIEYHEGDSGGGAGRGTALIDWGTISGFGYSATGYNTWRIEVTRESSNNIKVYFNDHHIGTATDHTYLDRPYFGTFLYPTNELGGVATKWEYFKVQ